MNKHLGFELLEEEVDFLKPQILEFHRRYPSIPLVMLTRNNGASTSICEQHPELRTIAKFATRRQAEIFNYPSLRMFVTSEQWAGIPGIPSYCSFHGQPSKGLTLQIGAARDFDGFLCLGELQKSVIKNFYMHNYGNLEKCPTLYDVGYPKSDKLINGEYDRGEVLKEIGLPTDRPTVLYAPAFNECASMREVGNEVLRRLLEKQEWNVIAKLAVDCWLDKSNRYANGGINWFEELSKFSQYPNFHLYRKTGIDPLLEAADVLVTCVSSVAFEFLAIGKPVVYIDTPKFFSHYLKMYFPHEDTESWANDVGVNAGRDFGTLVKDMGDLVSIVESQIVLGKSEKLAGEMQAKLLFNPGRATEKMVDTLHELYLRAHVSHKGRIRDVTRRILKFTFRKSVQLAKSMLGYSGSYIGCKATVKAASQSGLGLNEYLESLEDSPRKRGRRDGIISEMKNRGALDITGKHVLEIGAGTGRFLEKMIEAKPKICEIYEIDKEWSSYLQRTYGTSFDVKLIVHHADGISLNRTKNASVDCVYAHGVFVYTPFVTTVGYMREIARVSKLGGLVVFDVFYDTDWNLSTARAWEHSGHRFPVVLSRTLVEACYAELGFEVEGEFTSIYGASMSRYVLLKKNREIKF